MMGDGSLKGWLVSSRQRELAGEASSARLATAAQDQARAERTRHAAATAKADVVAFDGGASTPAFVMSGRAPAPTRVSTAPADCTGSQVHGEGHAAAA